MDNLIINFLGQAGFKIDINNTSILIDPYLSNSVSELDSEDLVRQVDIPIAPEKLKNISWTLITHDHIDHCDPKTLPLIYSNNKDCFFVGPSKVRNILRSWGINSKQIVKATEKYIDLGKNLRIKSTLAAHPNLEYGDDGFSNYIGWIMELGSKKVYFAGDTSVCDELLNELKSYGSIDIGFLPVNEDNFFRRRRGIIGNMSIREAFELAAETGIKEVFPVHWDMFKVNSAIPKEIKIIYDNYSWPFKLTMGLNKIKI